LTAQAATEEEATGSFVKLGLNQQSLVGGLEPWNFMTFHSVGNVIIPTDFNSIIFQRGRSTTNQIMCKYLQVDGTLILFIFRKTQGIQTDQREFGMIINSMIGIGRND